MAKILWLASYPKSGNTWMRAFLANYRAGGESPVDINEIGGGPIASSRALFDDWAGLQATDLPPELVERLRPEAYRDLARQAAAMIYMKVHDAWRPIFPADVSHGALYIVRHPLDVACSAAHHWGISPAESASRMCKPGMILAAAAEGPQGQLPQPMTDWSGHVQSWLDESGLVTLTVRYEDLLREPVEFFSQVVRFAGLEVDRGRVERAVLASSFDELQGQERARGFREMSSRAPGGFFRRGQMGVWREELPPESAALLLQAHEPMMRRLGYWDESAA